MTTAPLRLVTGRAARIASALALLSALLFSGAAPALCETIVFEGKTECQEAQDVFSPHSTDAQKKEAQEIEAASRAENKEPAPSSIFEGKITFVDIFVDIGTTVGDSQPLVEYTLPKGVIQYELSQIETSKTKQNMHMLEQIRLDLRNRKRDLDQTVNDYRNGFASAAQVDDLRQQIIVLQSQASTLESVIRSESDFDAAKFSSAKARLGVKSKDPSKFPKTGLILSQVNGQVLWKSPELILGGTISKYTRLMRVGNLRSLAVKCWVPEKYIAQVKTGMPVTVTFESQGNVPIQGKVGRISGGGGLLADVQLPSIFLVFVEIPNDDMRFKEGMRARVTMEVPD